MLLDIYPFPRVLLSAAERLLRQPEINPSSRMNRNASTCDVRQYSAPIASEDAVIIFGDQDTEQAVAHRNVTYLTKDGEVRRAHERLSFYEPPFTVLLFLMLIMPMYDMVKHREMLSLFSASVNFSASTSR